MEKACVPCFMKVNCRKLMLWQDDSILMNKTTEKLSSPTVSPWREFFSVCSVFVFLAFFPISFYKRAVIRELGFWPTLWTIKISATNFPTAKSIVDTLCSLKEKPTQRFSYLIEEEI